ncbi:S8 family serine peptidase [Rhodococcus sp. CX]|nr:S8 family serine peptidase [Rhodococcus sp. CX]
MTHPDLHCFNGWTVGMTGPLQTYGAASDVPNFSFAHGTRVAGIAAAGNSNFKGVSGMAGDCPIMPIALVDNSISEIARGIVYATDTGARVINMSFGGYPRSSVIEHAIEYAYNRNVVMCAASGNGNQGTISFPANHPYVIAVGATQNNDTRVSIPGSWGSNWGDELSVMAPGIPIGTTDVQGNGDLGDTRDYFTRMDGTSAAAPHVSGLAALILSVESSLTPDEVRNLIERSADKVGGVGYPIQRKNGRWSTFMGYGRINALTAIRRTRIYIWDPKDLLSTAFKPLPWTQQGKGL